MLRNAVVAAVLALTLTLTLTLTLALAWTGAPARAASLEEGQIWRYDTRPGEEGSRLFIARIDRGLGGQTIYHIYLDGLQLKNPLFAGGVQDRLLHAPVTREALEASVTELLQSDAEMPDISEGYAEWLLAFEKGQAGVFPMPVKEIVQYIEDAFAQAK
jgi:hypothetical protein